MKKVVLKVEFHDDKVKQKAMKIVAGLSGVESVAVDMKDKKLTVTGEIDPVTVARKLRKLCHTEIVTVGPAKEPEKKKEERKKEEPKQDDKKKDDGQQAHFLGHTTPYYYQQPYYYPMPYYYRQPYYYQQQAYTYHQPTVPNNQRSAEEDPNSGVIYNNIYAAYLSELLPGNGEDFLVRDT